MDLHAEKNRLQRFDVLWPRLQMSILWGMSQMSASQSWDKQTNTMSPQANVRNWSVVKTNYININCPYARLLLVICYMQDIHLLRASFTRVFMTDRHMKYSKTEAQSKPGHINRNPDIQHGQQHKLSSIKSILSWKKDVHRVVTCN